MYHHSAAYAAKPASFYSNHISSHTLNAGLEFTSNYNNTCKSTANLANSLHENQLHHLHPAQENQTLKNTNLDETSSVVKLNQLLNYGYNNLVYNAQLPAPGYFQQQQQQSYSQYGYQINQTDGVSSNILFDKSSYMGNSNAYANYMSHQDYGANQHSNEKYFDACMPDYSCDLEYNNKNDAKINKAFGLGKLFNSNKAECEQMDTLDSVETKVNGKLKRPPPNTRDNDLCSKNSDESEMFRNGATLRERNRMHVLNDAFDELRTIVPKSNLSEHQRLSKIATLRLAIHYIGALTKILQNSGGCRPVDPSLLPAPPRRRRRRKFPKMQADVKQSGDEKQAVIKNESNT